MLRDAYAFARGMDYGPIPSAAYAAQMKAAQVAPTIAATALAGAAGYGANHLLGNPIGGAIDAVTGNYFNLKPDTDAQWATTGNPTAIDAYNRMGGVGDNLYRQQLNDSMWAAEKAARLRQDLDLASMGQSERLKAELATQAANQAYAQELGLQTNKLQAEREMQNNSLAAAQANQLLNGYLGMIKSASDRAAVAASARF